MTDLTRVQDRNGFDHCSVDTLNPHSRTWDSQSIEWDGFFLTANPVNENKEVKSRADSDFVHRVAANLEHASAHISPIQGLPCFSLNSAHGTSHIDPVNLQTRQVQGNEELLASVFPDSECPNLRAGRIPCACTEADEMLLKTLKSRGFNIFTGLSVPTCQIDGCSSNLQTLKEYHRRHRVCEEHTRVTSILHAGCMQRYCQQCGRFHPLTDFDEGKRSCRRKLERHNKRRRQKKQSEDEQGQKKGSLSDSSGKQECRCDSATDSPTKAASCCVKEGVKEGGAEEGSQSNGSQSPGATRGAGSRPKVGESCCRPGKKSRSTSSPVGPAFHPSSQPPSSAAANTDVLSSSSGTSEAEDAEGPGSQAAEQGVQGAASGEQTASVPPTPALHASASTPASPPASAALPAPLAQLAPHFSSPQFASSSVWGTAAGLPSRVPSWSKVMLPAMASSQAQAQAQAEAELGCAGRVSMPVHQHTLTPLHAAPATLPSLPLLNTQGKQQTQQDHQQQQQHVNLPLPEPPLPAPAPAAAFPGGDGEPRRWLDQSSLLALLLEGEEEGQGAWQTHAKPQEQTQYKYTSQAPTRHVSFKLYDWNPADFPRNLRNQIMEWLSHMPSDLEGYIRPGCTILTLRMAMQHHQWHQLHDDVVGSLQRLLDSNRTLCRHAHAYPPPPPPLPPPASPVFGCGTLLVHLGGCHTAAAHNGEVVGVSGVESSSSSSLATMAPELIPPIRPLCVVPGTQSPTRLMLTGRRITQNASCRLLVHVAGQLAMPPTAVGELKAVQSHGCGCGCGPGCGCGCNCGVVQEEEEEEEEVVCVPFPAVPRDVMGSASIELDPFFVSTYTSPVLSVLLAPADVCRELAEWGADLDKEEEEEEGEEYDGVKAAERREQVQSVVDDLGWELAAMNRGRQNSSSSSPSSARCARLAALLRLAVGRGWTAVTALLLQAVTQADDTWQALAGLGEVATFAGSVGVAAGSSLLHVAVHGRQAAAMVRMLVEFGRERERRGSSEGVRWWDASWQGRHGITALHLAAVKEDADDVITALIGQDVDQALAWMNSRDMFGKSPHDYALSMEFYSYDEIVGKILLSFALFPTAVSSSDWPLTEKLSQVRPSDIAVLIPPPDAKWHSSEDSSSKPLIQVLSRPTVTGVLQGSHVASEGYFRGFAVMGDQDSFQRGGLFGYQILKTAMFALVVCAGLCLLLADPRMEVVARSFRRCLASLK